MNFKGMEKFEKHVPDLKTTGGRVRIGLYALALFTLVTAYFIVSDNIPTWSIDSQIIIVALGFLIMSMFFSRRGLYREKYKELAYRQAFVHFCIPGLALILSAVAHAAYMNGPFVPRGWWTIVFTTLGWYTLISGAILGIRSILTFGVDYLTMLYVYQPEESEIVNSSIYGVLRHPVYAGVLRVGIGLALLNGNANALAFALLMPLGLTGWIRLVEERELIERFGKSYLEYRIKVPAFWPRIKDIPAYIRFLITGK
jgi:protein-S-isoprenylcysteine O-methyltransferase Ste14